MQKVDSAGTFNYVCDGTTPASPVLKDGSAVYTPGLSERRGSTSKFYHGDALGSTRGITNSSQSVTDSVLYDSFGMNVSRTGTTPTPFGFVGKGQYQTDSDSGLMLLGHRYYDAGAGRFISSDPAKAGDNWYAYCDNNPLKETDPLGLDPPKTYGTIIEAVNDAMKTYVPISDKNKHEQGGWIVTVPVPGKKPRYKIVVAPPGSTGEIDLNNAPPGTVADWHTHPGPYFDDPHNPILTDPGDQNLTDRRGYPGYAGSGNGWIAINDPRPSHKKDPYPDKNKHDGIIVGVPYKGVPEPNIAPGEIIGRKRRWK